MHSGCQIQSICRTCMCLATVQTWRRHDVKIRSNRILMLPKFDPSFQTLPTSVTFSVRRASLCFWNSVRMGTNSMGFEFELVLTAGCADTGGKVSPDARFWRPHAQHARSSPPKCPTRVRIASAHSTHYRGGRADLWKVVWRRTSRVCLGPGGRAVGEWGDRDSEASTTPSNSIEIIDIR